MNKKYRPATLATLQDDIENLHKEVKELKELIERMITELYHKSGITLNLEEVSNE